MSIYIYRNNQRFGPYEDAQIADMLASNAVNLNDMAIRHGETEWTKLADLVGPSPAAAAPPTPVAAARAASPAPAATAVVGAIPSTAVEAAPKKRGWAGYLLGCGGVLFVVGAIGAAAGLYAWTNLNPADQAELRPSEISGYKLKTKGQPRGDVWGSQRSFMAMYEKEKDDTILYLVTVYRDADAASGAFSKDLLDSCRRSETPVRFKFSKEGRQVAEGATCGGGIYIKNGDKVAVVGSLGSGGVSDLVDFADNIPLTAGTTRTAEDK